MFNCATHACTYVHMQVDTITPLPGVTVREAGRTISGPKSLQPRGGRTYINYHVTSRR